MDATNVKPMSGNATIIGYQGLIYGLSTNEYNMYFSAYRRESTSKRGQTMTSLVSKGMVSAKVPRLEVSAPN